MTNRDGRRRSGVRGIGWLAIIVAGVGAALAAPATALATNAYVDKETGTGSACTLATPCATIAAGIAAATTGGTVFVDDSPSAYAENLTLGNGESLQAMNFAGGAEGATIIDGGSGTAITVPLGDAAGTVSGFTIRGGTHAILAESSLAVTGNTFDQSTPVSSGDLDDVRFLDTSTQATVTGNTFTDSTNTDDQHAVGGYSTAAAAISNNTISGFSVAIEWGAASGTTSIAGNDITGTHGTVSSDGVSIKLQDQATTLTANYIHAGGTNPGEGVELTEGATPAVTSATFLRNRILEVDTGVGIGQTGGAVTFNGDVIAHNTSYGINSFDVPPGNEANFSATNATLFDNGVNDINMQDSDVVLNSVIVQHAIGINGTVNCTITFSRGPTTSGTPCETFQTSAGPGFVNPAGNDYHLASGSPMIDQGDPAITTGTDFDGDPRAIAGTCGGVARADVGADEFVPTCAPAGGGGQTSAPSNAFAFGSVVLHKPKGTATVDVELPAAGRVALGGDGLKGTSAQAAGPGEVALLAKPNGRTKRKLKDTGKATVTAEVTFTPTGGASNTQSERLKLKLKGG